MIRIIPDSNSEIISSGVDAWAPRLNKRNGKTEWIAIREDAAIELEDGAVTWLRLGRKWIKLVGSATELVGVKDVP